MIFCLCIFVDLPTPVAGYFLPIYKNENENEIKEMSENENEKRKKCESLEVEEESGILCKGIVTRKSIPVDGIPGEILYEVNLYIFFFKFQCAFSIFLNVKIYMPS